MKYLLVYQNYSIQYYPQNQMIPNEEYTVGRITPDNHPYIGFDSSLKFIGRQHGLITSLHNRLYYIGFFTLAPTLFNNQKMKEETLPLESRQDISNVFTIKEAKYPQAFIFTSDHTDWNIYRLRKKDVKMGNLQGINDIVIDDILTEIAVFKFINGQYYLIVSESAQNDFLQVIDDDTVETICENICLDKERTYRFIYKKTHMFIVGGPVILYGKV